MSQDKRSRIIPAARAAACAGLLLCSAAHADGMVPQTSVVIVNEAEGEASISVTNKDKHLSLLHVTLEDIPEDKEPLLFVTPNLSRVEAGKQQLVRFVLLKHEPLKTQRLKRVTFEGIPPTKKDHGEPTARVGVTVRQNLPVIIHPKGLAPNREPWKGLAWSIRDGQLKVGNDTPYIVRMAQEVRLLPGDKAAMLPRTYVLPGEHLSVPLPAGLPASTSVRIFPATVYGFAVDSFEAPLQGTSS
jgi:P pilus assembly chaperone PapD